MPVETDRTGRLQLPAHVRERYGERFHVVEREDRVELVPIADDPLKAARAAASGAFEGVSAPIPREEMREEAREAAVAEADDDAEPTRDG